MQDRYFGDVGDYGKYGLLRALAGVYPHSDRLRLGIVWYLTDNETHNNDGKHVGYLAQPHFRACDPDLFDGLRSVSELPRAVSLVQNMGVFPAETVFHDEVLNLAPLHWEGRLAVRARWYESALELTADCEVVFCDPDNGISERAAVLRSGKGAKFVSLDEIAGFYSRGQSVVVYHHADRSATVPEQAARRASQLREQLGTDDVFALRFGRGTTRLYFIAPAPAHSEVLRQRAVRLVAGPWGAHFAIA